MKKHLDFPEELVTFLEAEAAKNYRTFRDEVVARCTGFGIFLDARIAQIGLNANTSQTEVHQTSSTPVMDDSGTESVRERIQMVDMLLADGDPKRPGSNFQRRRRRQVALLKDAWSELFPEEPAVLDKNVKQWLALRNNYAEDVYDCFEVVARKGIHGVGLVAYVAKVVADVPKTDITGQMRADSPYGGYTTPDSWKIRPMTEAEKKEQEEVERWAIEQGLWNPETDREPRE